MGKLYQVMVHGLIGQKTFINLCNTEEQMKKMTVKQLKEKISEKIPDYQEEENIKLIFIDKELEGDSTLLSDYGIQHMSVIHLVISLPGGGGPLPEHQGMGDKTDQTRWSMERLGDFQDTNDKSFSQKGHWFKRFHKKE